MYAILPGISKGTSSEPSNNAVTTLATKNATTPRGLIRLFSPVLEGGRYDLVNFIAIEPVVGGKRGLSELELSRLDGVPGKRIWVSGGVPPQMPGEAGRLTKLKSGVEELEVVLRVERFDNGDMFTWWQLNSATPPMKSGSPFIENRTVRPYNSAS